MAESRESFIDLVQAHERAWGVQSYPDRPSLADLLNAPLVAWRKSANEQEDRLMATVHKNAEELNKYLTRILLHSRHELPDKRLAAVHINQKKAAIRGVSLHLIAPDE